ncbi:sarcosine oxidase subunit alpha family protein [Kutzneria viridogrisea]|uniref:Sarcosine oxidase subunit alpha n=1 Tax=Kutzneria viridogrisea TaxID=47990 RepID=A0ABR6BMY2_9PSEU|nr:sarcosine oxidase subunit alpha [Kutzneria viridogrisea]
MTAHRLPNGGRVDRAAPVRFTYDGKRYTGLRGDTLASALIANGVLEVAPSSYRGRPRGIVTAGVDEPNALVLVDGSLLPATTLELHDGLSATGRSGVGRLTDSTDSVRHDKRYVHCDVLVVGGGPAGLAAAQAAGRTGARTILADERTELGGTLLATKGFDLSWPGLAEFPETRVLSRTTAVGYYDQNYVVLAQRNTLWHVRAKRVVLATGAHERPLVFADNDRPGVMLASAVREYVNRYAVAPGQNVVLATTNDSAYQVALDLIAAGITVSAIVDSRPEPPAALVNQVGVEVITGSAVTGTEGRHRVSAVHIGPDRSIPCDLLAVSGGWNPAVHMFSQAQGRVRYEERIAAFVPDTCPQDLEVVGAANATYELAACLAEGAAAGARAAHLAGFGGGTAPELPPVPAESDSAHRPVWMVEGDETLQFIDLQRDSTVADIRRATGAGLRSVEHVKRYTTVGTGLDQGRTGGVPAIGVIAELLGASSPGEVGTTTYRPPYTPVSFALLAGRDRGELHDPIRRTAMHSWHVAHGAVFEDVGQWKRPHHYPRAGEDAQAAVLRECTAARTGLAMMDASTLGKIEVQGPDAGEFLNRMYTNAFAKLAIGSCRYGMLCRADGMVFDDGVVLRLAEDRYLTTTTTGNAAAVLDWFEEWQQTEWPELRVRFTSVTEQWATIAVVGPGSRAALTPLLPDLDLSAAAFGFMTFRDTVLCNGVPARVARVSFSGELAFEINVATWHGLSTWELVANTGATPYGTETMHVLRAEKGFVIVGQDTDGTVTPQDLGMDWIVSKRKDFVGRRSFSRPDTARPDRRQLVGLLPVDPDDLLPEGAQLVAGGVPLTPPVPMLGHVTSSYRSAALGRTFALALVAGGRDLIGRELLAPLGNRVITATVTEPIFYDPEGTRRDG